MTLEEDVTDYANAIEAAAVNLKHRIARRHGVDVKEETKPQYDLSKIKTTRTEGPSGFYEKANEQDGEDYRLLVEDLKAHDNKLTRNGFFVWLFSDKKSVGIKPSKK